MKQYGNGSEKGGEKKLSIDKFEKHKTSSKGQVVITSPDRKVLFNGSSKAYDKWREAFIENEETDDMVLPKSRKLKPDLDTDDDEETDLDDEQ